MTQSKACKKNDMKLLGITGGIGSGKSLVLSILSEEPGAYIVEADRLAHTLMKPGHTCYRRIVDCFGEEILGPDGTIDRERLGRKVFQDEEALACLNRIVHPSVKRCIRARIRRARERGVRLFVIEAALLIQDGYRSICDALWYIHVDRELRIHRLLESRGGTREKWEAVLSSQPEDHFFSSNTDVTIENDGAVEELREKTSKELQRLFLM